METLDRSGLVALEPLELANRRTVGEIVDGMARCSFGARMLGEVAATIVDWMAFEQRPTIVYDGEKDTRLGKLLQYWVSEEWAAGVVAPEEYAKMGGAGPPRILVIGGFSERYAEKIFWWANLGQAIFINPFGLAAPGQITDGHFPNAVFADPRYVMLVLTAVMEERLGNKPWNMRYLMGKLEPFGGLATEVAAGAGTLRAMIQDPDCTVFMTLSGAMTVAKMGPILCDFIDGSWVQYIASTGALMAHGLIEGMGRAHLKYDPSVSDVQLADQKLNRMTDTLEPEENFDLAADLLDEALNEYDAIGVVTSPVELHRKIGRLLTERYPDQRAILASAYRKGVPIAVPAFVDSELGNDTFVHNRRREMEGRGKVLMDLELDSALLMEMARNAKKMGIFSIGGGVPRNNTQNIAPLMEITADRLGIDLPTRMYSYGCKICPDVMWLGHLGGCTYPENMSWRKFWPDARVAEVHADATIVLPFYGRFLMDNIK